MTTEKFLAIIMKRWWIILICCVGVGFGAYIGSKLLTPLYQSTALVQIAIRSSNNQGDYYTSLLASEQLVQTESTLATSDPVLREVASHYPGLTADQLSREVTAAPKLNTQLFEIDVQNSRPISAATLANDIAMTLIKQQAQMFQQYSVQSDVYLLLVQSAQPNFSSVQPHVLFNTSSGLVAGLLLGMLLVVLFELLDMRVRTPEALTQLLGWPVLTTIWRAHSKEEVFNPKGNNANFESYRMLRSKNGFSKIDKPVQTLMVTSATSREGRSIIAANLAICIARTGKNTLLIDADFRRPVLGDLFGIPGDSLGLSDALLAFDIPTTANASANNKFRTVSPSVPHSNILPVNQKSLDLFTYAVNIPNLCVMPSGPLSLNPSELFDSKAMQHLFMALNSCGAEVVIFDTSPLLGLSDASILASKVDCTLVVVNITCARKENLKKVKSLLEQTGSHVLGIVLNKQRRRRRDPIYSYHDAIHVQKGEEDLELKHSCSLPTSPAIADDLVEPEKSSELALQEQKSDENHSTNKGDTPIVLASAMDANSPTIKLFKDNRRQCD